MAPICMNSKDLRAVEHVERLVKMGVDSLKIEGRTKSHYYVARTAQVYRQGHRRCRGRARPLIRRLLGKLENLANRGYTDGFYPAAPSQRGISELPRAATRTGIKQRFVGELGDYHVDTGMVDVEVKNKFAVGDSLELILPGGNKRFVLEQLEDQQGVPMEVVPGGGYRVRIPLAAEDHAMGLLARDL